MEVDRRREVRGIPEAAGLSLDAHDLAVETFSQGFADVRGEMRQEFADVRGHMNREFVDIRSDMNQRFAQIDQRFMWLFGTQLAVLLAVIAALTGAYYR